MPYRRLPNTDAARLKALHTALQKGEELSPVDLAYPQKHYYNIRSFIPSFEAALQDYAQKKDNLVRQSKQTHELFRKARLFLTHFIQVTFFAIQRGELPENTLEYFGLDSSRTMPSLQSFEELVTCGKKILEGEKERIQQGKRPISNPTAAVVKVRYEVFLESFHSYEVHKKTKTLAQEKVLSLRKEADRLIAGLWDYIEDFFEDLPDNMKREKAAGYGIIYVYRKNELRHLESFPD
jgi:hypothetical protein